jgi:hypothetical protein
VLALGCRHAAQQFHAANWHLHFVSTLLESEFLAWSRLQGQLSGASRRCRSFGKRPLALGAGAYDFGYVMNVDCRHTVLSRVRLRQDLKPIRALAGSESDEVDWLAIVRVVNNQGGESFDLVFLRSDGAAFPWMGFETLKIAKDQAHANVGVEYVEWEPCNIELTNADRSINWDGAVPGAEQAACI